MVVCRSSLPSGSSSSSRSFVIMIVLLSCFMCVELVVGVAVSSLAMVSDVFHMLGDVLALVIGLWADKAVRNSSPNPRSTYGSVRAEVVGALINGVFLLAICLFLVKEAGVEMHEILLGDALAHRKSHGDTLRIIAVGSIGFVVNCLGMCLFGEHGHGHSHGEESGHSHSSQSHHSHDLHSHSMTDISRSETSHQCTESHSSVNKRAVYLHVMSDCLSSLAVVASGLVLMFWDSPPALLADPICSLLTVAIIFKSTMPLLTKCVNIVMQNTPSEVSFGAIKIDLLKVNGVQSVHELHIWQLSQERNIASVHIRYDIDSYYSSEENGTSLRAGELLLELQTVFHRHGIHETTIQIEHSRPKSECDDLLCGKGLCDAIQLQMV